MVPALALNRSSVLRRVDVHERRERTGCVIDRWSIHVRVMEWSWVAPAVHVHLFWIWHWRSWSTGRVPRYRRIVYVLPVTEGRLRSRAEMMAWVNWAEGVHAVLGVLCMPARVIPEAPVFSAVLMAPVHVVLAQGLPAPAV